MQENKPIILSKIDEALAGLDIRMEAVKKQGITNAGLYSSFHSGLLQLKEVLNKDMSVSREFKEKWKVHMAYVSRFFEEDPLSNTLFEINKLLFEK